MRIQILIDIKDSFFHKYIDQLKNNIKPLKHRIKIINSHRKIKKGDVLFLISCKTILNKQILTKNSKNVVIHPSKLPLGRGSAVVAWRVLENKKKIFITLFEANEGIDRGDIYLQKFFRLDGSELSDEIREKQAKLTISLIKIFLKKMKKIKKKPQLGKTSFYRKRTKKDSEININKSIRKQFNLLRVTDNKRYPAFFYFKKKKYILKIYAQK